MPTARVSAGVKASDHMHRPANFLPDAWELVGALRDPGHQGVNIGVETRPQTGAVRFVPVCCLEKLGASRRRENDRRHYRYRLAASARIASQGTEAGKSASAVASRRSNSSPCSLVSGMSAASRLSQRASISSRRSLGERWANSIRGILVPSSSHRRPIIPQGRVALRMQCEFGLLPQMLPRANNAKGPLEVTLCYLPELSWKIWSERQDSNLRPPVPQTDALPGCATLRP
ncbi:hypothetical protein MTBSS4_300023 [Magnetospirillum sp. SS-4]|nr:hypothetical protein MTBSS4_300023 [Magnetospirillum sp. SS-4]